jgi:hypothetical protein
VRTYGNGSNHSPKYLESLLSHVSLDLHSISPTLVNIGSGSILQSLCGFDTVTRSINS